MLLNDNFIRLQVEILSGRQNCSVCLACKFASLVSRENMQK